MPIKKETFAIKACSCFKVGDENFRRPDFDLKSNLKLIKIQRGFDNKIK